MDLEHHNVYNGDRPKGPSSVIKLEPRSVSPCYQNHDNLRSPPMRSDLAVGGVLTGNIAASKRARTTDDWLPVSERSPGAVSMPPNSSNGIPSNLSPSPGPAMHPGIYPSTSNGYPSPTMSTGSYDPYGSSSKLSVEDLSPNSQNGYMDVCDASKKKKGPTATTRQQEELCLVCGDRASGYHYNALTCEGCKGFFRRSITKNAVYQCKYGNYCDIDMYMRRKCQECRLKKCLSVGMRPECVVPEYQCAVKRKEKKAQKDKDKPNSTTNGSPESIKVDPELQRVESQTMSSNGIKPVSSEQEELIRSLVYFQEQYEEPPEEEVRRVFNSNDSFNGYAESDSKYKQITELTILTVQLIVEFAKNLPGFDKLLREDQITLLKACSSEVMMLRMARKYDAETNSIVFANNEPYSKDSYMIAGMGDNIEELLRFGRQMWSMKVDNAEYALLTAIVIFSYRPSLQESWKVEKIQEVYIETLKSYVHNRIPTNSVTTFARLLSVLTELRTLGNSNFEACMSVKLNSKILPPFLSEIWDVVS